jgi:hypothetical protein
MSQLGPGLRNSIVNTWNNGGRLMLIAAAIAMSALMIVLATNVAILLGIGKDTNPLRYAGPVQVRQSLDPSKAEVIVTRCNDSNRTVRVSGMVYWEPTSEELDNIIISRLTRTIGPLCLTRILTVDIPVGITGTWRIVGVECIIDSSLRHCATWASEPVSLGSGGIE